MKPEEQRIAIAKACGWQHLPAGTYGPEDCWFRYEPTGERVRSTVNLPDYLNDLNAVHEAEKVLPDIQLYIRFLYLTVLEDPENVANEVATTTAAQRAEAFLRTLNLWTE